MLLPPRLPALPSDPSQAQILLLIGASAKPFFDGAVSENTHLFEGWNIRKAQRNAKIRVEENSGDLKRLPKASGNLKRGKFAFKDST